MAILAILLAVTIPAMNSIFGGMNLNRAAGMVTDELNLARQTALAQNRNVEVRFYRLGAASGDTNKQFRALRSYLVEDVDAADWKPITRLKRLPEPIIISASPTYSTLLDAMNSEFSGLTHSNEMVPGNGDTEYVGFFFRPDGGTSLKPASGKWFMTLHPMKGADATTLPANYFTVQVDPLTGRPRSFQP